MGLRLVAERLVAGGAAIARADDGRVVFVDGALPGEIVDAEITLRKKDYARGRATTIVEASDDRVAPPCPHRLEGCGGCGWMHLAPAAQVDAKAGIVEESLRRVGRLDGPTVDALVEVGGSVAPTGYRTSIRVVGDADGRPAFREARSDRAVDIDGCLVAHPLLRDVIGSTRLDPGVEADLRVSLATGDVSIRARGGGRIRRAPRGAALGGTASVEERVAGHMLRVSAASFFQSGPEAARLLVSTVTEVAPEFGGASHLLDAYGGVGLFGVASGASRVTVVESSRTACADAAHNLAARTASVVRREVGAWRPSGPPIDLVVADPARPGLGRPGVAALTAIGDAPIVLVSCDPVSLARDSALLRGAGYRLSRVVVVDLMPQTSHVETVSRFDPPLTT